MQLEKVRTVFEKTALWRLLIFYYKFKILEIDVCGESGCSTLCIMHTLSLFTPTFSFLVFLFGGRSSTYYYIRTTLCSLINMHIIILLRWKHHYSKPSVMHNIIMLRHGYNTDRYTIIILTLNILQCTNNNNIKIMILKQERWWHCAIA